MVWILLGKAVWIGVGRWYGFRYIKAEPPCMKGEIDFGAGFIGWQR